MGHFTISSNQFEDILKRLDSLERELAKKQPTIQDKFLDNQELIQLMHISKRCAQNWRNENRISYSQIGGKIYYRMSDVQKLLDCNYINASNSKNGGGHDIK